MGKCKFAKEWMDKKDSSGNKISVWAERRGEHDLFCTVCQCTVSVAKGFYAIKQHFETPKHQSNFARVKDTNQLIISNSDQVAHGQPGIRVYSVRDSAYTAELIWCLKMVSGNIAANFAQDIASVFKAMFPSAVPEQFSLNPTKVRYLMTDALGPYFRNRLLKEIGSSYFSLMFDETTNNAGRKELQTAIRFWSEEKNEVVCHHLETFYLGHATAEILKDKLLIALNNADLPIPKLLMIGCDGPKVNQKVFSLMNEEIKEIRGKGLVDLGYCNIHMIHNAFLKGLDELGSDASELIISVYYFFHDWPSRWEDFTNIQNSKDLPNMHFIKHATSRWLTIEPAGKRLLEQWDAVIEYFLKFIPMHNRTLMNTNGYKRVILLLKNKTIKAELKFVCVSAALFTGFTRLYQREAPLIHVLHEHVKNLVLSIMGRSCKVEAIENVKKSLFADAFNNDSLLPLKDMPLSDEMESLLAHLSHSERQIFISQMRKHYVAAGKYITGKKVITSRVLRSFGCLQPPIEPDKSVENQKKLKIMAGSLPLAYEEEKLMDEWKLLQLEHLEYTDKMRIEHYWSQVFKLKTVSDTIKYPYLTMIVKASLTLSHGNADIERSFSRSGRILTEDRASMSERTLNAKLNIADGLKGFDNKPHLVPITNELISSARNAHKSYEDYLLKERQKAEEEKKKKIEEEQFRILEEEKRQKLEKSKETIEKLKSELKVAKGLESEQVSAVDTLLKEARSKLDEAIKKKDFVAVSVAQAMLEGAMKNTSECRQKRKAIDGLEKKLNKKKDSVITTFFNKKPKT